MQVFCGHRTTLGIVGLLRLHWCVTGCVLRLDPGESEPDISHRTPRGPACGLSGQWWWAVTIKLGQKVASVHVSCVFLVLRGPGHVRIEKSPMWPWPCSHQVCPGLRPGCIQWAQDATGLLVGCPEQSTSYGGGQAAGAWYSVCGGDQVRGRGQGVLCDPRRLSQGAGCHQGGWAPSTHGLHVEGPGQCSLATACHEASPCV